jgi:predicted DNA-binding helix-hairpin-helix protein
LKCDHYLCKYCFTSCAIRRKRTTFKPDELATTLVSLRQQRRVEGLFLSPGILPDANTAMEKMLATVERLRLKEGCDGYIHLKLIPDQPEFVLDWARQWQAAEKIVYSRIIAEPRSARTRLEREFYPDAVRWLKPGVPAQRRTR